VTTEELTLPLRVGEDFEMVPVRIEIGDEVRVSVARPGRPAVTGDGHDLLQALRTVRLALEDNGELLWVNGALRNVHASGMLRDGAAGRRAYLLPPERGRERPPVVSVLDGAPPDADVVTVAEQDAWFEGWVATPLPDDGSSGPSGSNDDRRAPRTPSPEARAAAKGQPGGWVYDIEGDYAPDDAVPPRAVRGAWKVDESGEIVGEFIENPRFEADAR
jgi:hypothetical protein